MIAVAGEIDIDEERQQPYLVMKLEEGSLC